MTMPVEQITYAIPQRYSAENEIAFLRDLAARRPGWFTGYAAIILKDQRWWDSTVDVAKVKAECERLLEIYRRRGTS